jgi:squalene-hopene/tetraprenyl-beta-curcumene cyclase
MEAEYILLREFLGIRTSQETIETANWIRSRQLGDGTWSTYYGGPPDLSTSVEAYVALRLAGDRPDAPHMLRAEHYIRCHGGIAACRVFTRIWLALFGVWPWDELPVLPPELIYLPRRFPLNIYDWAAVARQTIVPLTVVTALRPIRRLPFDLAHLGADVRPQPVRHPPWSWASVFSGLDRALHVAERRPIRAVRQAALRRVAEWILARQESDGSWGGVQPPWVYSLIALRLLGYELDHPAVRRGLAGLETFIIREETSNGAVRRFETCQSPVWDTALAVIALADAGLSKGHPADHPALLSAVRWLLDRQTHGPGDWAIRRPGLVAGGWPFGFSNETYPDMDDTALVVLALARIDEPVHASRIDAAIGRATRWLAGMQSRDGGFAAFDADNARQLCTKLPFCDFGEVVDPPSADVTAHIVEALARVGRAQSPTVRRGVAWLLLAQRDDGSWPGRWGVNHIYGTSAVVPALIAAGVPPWKPTIRRAVRWLEVHQAADGGWGEDPRSYEDESWVGRGTSTASQTAWALLALLSAGERSSAVDRGVDWLIANQRSDGGWDEPHFTGTGYPGDFYFNFHLYRLVFPLRALALYVASHMSCAGAPPSRQGARVTAGRAHEPAKELTMEELNEEDPHGG